MDAVHHLYSLHGATKRGGWGYSANTASNWLVNAERAPYLSSTSLFVEHEREPQPVEVEVDGRGDKLSAHGHAHAHVIPIRSGSPPLLLDALHAAHADEVATA